MSQPVSFTTIADFFYLPEGTTISGGWDLSWTYWEGLPETDPRKIIIFNLLMKRRKRKGVIVYGTDTRLI